MGHRIFLLGFMGCGKSWWAVRLAERLEIPARDLDVLIEQEEGLSISDIFSQHGESYFRDSEARCLRQTVRWPDLVLATGGGTPMFYDNMRWMNDTGITIFLDPPAAVLTERLREETGLRPLLSGVKSSDLQLFIEQKLAERRPVYEQARIVLRGVQGPTFEDQLLKAVAQNR